MIPFTHPAQKIDQVDSENKDMGQSYMIQQKVIKNLLLLGVGVAKQFRVSMRCPKSIFPIRIIVFDQLEIIIFASQRLTLSTASLVISSSQVLRRFLCSHLSQIWIVNTSWYDDLSDIHGFKGTVEFTSPGIKFHFIVLG